MKIDLLRRLVLVLGGLGIAGTAMTYWASADEGVPVVSGTSSPFNPFERPIVPRTSNSTSSSAAPVTQAPSTPAPVVSVPSPSLAPRASSFRPAVVNPAVEAPATSAPAPAIVAASPVSGSPAQPRASANTPASVSNTIQPLPPTQARSSSSSATVVPARAPSSASFVPPASSTRVASNPTPAATPATNSPALQAPGAPAPVVVAQPSVTRTPPVLSAPTTQAPVSPVPVTPVPVVQTPAAPSPVASAPSFQAPRGSQPAPVAAAPAPSIQVVSPASASPALTAPAPTAPVARSIVSPSDRPVPMPIERLPQESAPQITVVQQGAPAIPRDAAVPISRPANTTAQLASPLPAVQGSSPARIATVEAPVAPVRPLSETQITPATVGPASVIPDRAPVSNAAQVSGQEPAPAIRSSVPALPVRSEASVPSVAAPTRTTILQETESVIIPEPEMETYGEEVILDGEMSSVVSDYGFTADCCRGCPSRSYVIAEGLLFNREGEFSQLSNNFAVDGFDPRVGGRATFGRRGDCLDGWDASYMTVEPWGAIATRAGGGLNAAFLPAGGLVAANVSAFNNADWQEQYYRSELHSAEVNRNFWGWDVVTTSYGLRYIQLDEQFRFTSLRGANRGDILINTNNQIFGPQIGSEWFYDIGGRFYLSGKLKAGAFMNVNDGSASLTNTGPVNTIISGADSNVGFSALGETQFNIFYKLTRNTRLRAGYELWYLYGAATANEQITSRVTPLFGRSIDDSDDVFFHGASVGFEWVR